MEDGQNQDFKVKIQRFGSYLSGMIMPNIGAFIAWGSLPHCLFRRMDAE